MPLQIGIVGLPNVGKSTLFNALTGATALVASYPFTTIEPNTGVVAVPDARLERLAAIVGPERLVPAMVEFVDIAGLVHGASQGEGLGNQFLGHIRNVDAVAMVVRCFGAPSIPHVTAELDPLGDIEVVRLELALADLAVVEKRLERVRSLTRGPQREDFLEELEFLKAARERLSRGEQAWCILEEQPERLKLALQELNLLTAKPFLYVANVGEEDLPDGGKLASRVVERAAAEGQEAVVLSAQVEEELSHWTRQEAEAFRQELGMGDSGLMKLIQAGYRLLSLITFFTTTGGHEVRAWTLPRGEKVLEAARKVHSDMAAGFIRAEVISFQELDEQGSFALAREKGLVRVEGADYLVQDGDVIHTRFRV